MVEIQLIDPSSFQVWLTWNDTVSPSKSRISIGSELYMATPSMLVWTTSTQISVGVKLGTELGLALGEALGLAEGIALGGLLGEVVGAALGAELTDGLALGASLGALSPSVVGA